MPASRRSPLSKFIRVHARSMREQPTDAERKLWFLLRGRRFAGFKFKRQVPFRSYILDLVCFEHRTVIEIDGSQHENSPSDRARDALLKQEGFQVLRYWNNDVLQRANIVLEDIFTHLSRKEH